ncbi:MAG: hypothetical protein OIF47_10035 [Marinibacterium sp.]|nr:hypothetical protein [Marinibacterium sp.]
MAETSTPQNVARKATKNGIANTNSTILLGVFGSDENLKAMIRLPSGRVKRIARGDRLRGGERVAGVDRDGVLLEKNGSTRRLPLIN